MPIGSSVRINQISAAHHASLICITAVDYEASTLAKSVNQVQKEIAAKKKVCQSMNF
jgi:hypothetical protein